MSSKQAGARSRARTSVILSVMVAGAFVAFLNTTLMNVALPKIMDSLQITATTAQWLSTIYMLVNGVLIPITAYLMERFSTRQLYITAMLFFSIGTFICGVGPNLSTLLVGRVIQAAGAGILFPLMMNVVFTLFPVEKRGWAMGIIGLAMNFAPAIGPTLSGWLVESHSWRILFFIILPIAVLDLIAAVIFLTNVTETKSSKLDSLSVMLSTVGFGGMLYGFTTAGDKGWGSTETIVTLLIGAVALALFVWRQLVVEQPILELRIFRYPMFTLTTIVLVVVTMAMYSGMILIPLYMQDIRGFSTLQSGLLLLPGGVLMGIMSPITGKLFDKIGARWLSIVGLLIMGGATYPLSKLTMDTNFYYMMFIYTLRMGGMSMLMMPIMTAGLNQLPQRFNPHGTALSNTIRTMAAAVGISLFVTVMANSSTANIKDLVIKEHVNPANKAAMHAVINQGTIMGVNDAFLVALVLSAIAVVLSFFIKKTSPMEDLITGRRKTRLPKGQVTSTQSV